MNLKTKEYEHYCKFCGEPQKGYGYCNKHYIRFKKYGGLLFVKYIKGK